MIRVPDTRAALIANGNPAHSSWQELSPAEIDRFIRQSRRAIRSHRRDALSPDVYKAETALAAIGTTRALLTELLDMVSPERRQEIERILDRE